MGIHLLHFCCSASFSYFPSAVCASTLFREEPEGCILHTFSCHPPLACAQDLSRTLLDTNGQKSRSCSVNAGMLLGLSSYSQRRRTLCGTTRSSFPMDCHEGGCFFVIDFSRYQALSSNKKPQFDATSGCGDTSVLCTHYFLDTVTKPLWLSELRESWLSTSFCAFARASREQALCVALVPDHTVCAAPPRILEQHAKDVRHHPAQSMKTNFLKKKVRLWPLRCCLVPACSSVKCVSCVPPPARNPCHFNSS